MASALLPSLLEENKSLPSSVLCVCIVAGWKKECQALLRDISSYSFPEHTKWLHINLDDEDEETEGILHITSLPTIQIYYRGTLVRTLEKSEVSVVLVNSAIMECMDSASAMDADDVLKLVSASYAATAKGSASCCVSVDSSMNGYSLTDLALAGAANLGLGCGNPLSFAALQSGETVVDLGSGAGVDCFIAGQQV
jgi:hypothetical protein